MGCARHNETAAGDLMLEIEADSASLVRDKNRQQQPGLFFGDHSGGRGAGNRRRRMDRASGIVDLRGSNPYWRSL